MDEGDVGGVRGRDAIVDCGVGYGVADDGAGVGRGTVFDVEGCAWGVDGRVSLEGFM